MFKYVSSDVIIPVMKSITAIALILKIFVLNGSLLHAGDLFEKYPTKDLVELSNGIIVEIPIRYTHTEALILTGSADIGLVNEYLKRTHAGVGAVETQRGQTLVSITGANHIESSIGSYQEVILAVLATKTKTKLNFAESKLALYSLYSPLFSVFSKKITEETGLYMIKILVDQDLALIAGKEIWGFSKSMAEIETRLDTDQLSFRAQSINLGTISFSNLDVGKSTTLPLSQKYNSITQTDSAHVVSTGKMKMGSVTSEQLVTTGWYKAFLDGVNFVPEKWLQAKALKWVLY